jgi:hypothetical protein
MNTTELEKELKVSCAYEHPAARRAIDEVLPQMYAAEKAGNMDEVDRLRIKLTQALHVIADALPSSPNPLPEDARQWCEALLDDPQHGYDEARDTLNIVLDADKGETAPSKEQVKAAFLRSLTKEQIAELQKLREPTLLIVPDTTAARFISAVDKPACKNQGAIFNQNDAYFDTNNFYRNVLSAIATQNNVAANQPKISKYRFVITEGKQHFDAQASDHDHSWNKREDMKNEDRIAAFENYLTKTTGLTSLNATTYLMLMIRGLKKGEPTDRISENAWQFTLLPGEPRNEHIKNGLGAYGYWAEDGRRAYFYYDNLGNEAAYARVRAAVMGEI